MDNNKEDDYSSDDASRSSGDMKGSESSSNSKRKRKSTEARSNSSSEESDEEYRPTRSRSGYAYRKYQSKSGEHKCGECGKSFCKKEILKNHMLVHSDIKPHKCPKCTARFKRKGDYNRHMLMHERTKGRIHTCPTCKLTFLRKNEYSRHILTHANMFPYKCKECADSKFSNVRALKKHTGRVNNSRSRCDVCCKSFKCKVAFKKHTDEHEFVLKEGRCGQCYAALSDKDELKAHLTTQCSVKPFICRQCEEGFKTKFELVKHEIGHRPPKLFRCNHCPHEFHVKAELIKHAMAEHESSNQNSCKEMYCNGKAPDQNSDCAKNGHHEADEIQMKSDNNSDSFQAAYIKENLKRMNSEMCQNVGKALISENGERNGDSIIENDYSSPEMGISQH